MSEPSEDGKPIALSYATPLPPEKIHPVVAIIRSFRFTLVIAVLISTVLGAMFAAYWIADTLSMPRSLHIFLVITITSALTAGLLYGVRRLH